MALVLLLFFSSLRLKTNIMRRHGKQRLEGLWGRDGAGEWGNWRKNLLTAQETGNVETQVELGR